MTSTDGPLRRQDQMDAGRARLLRQPRDQFLDLLADHHHQVGEFVDHHHDHRHGLQRLGIVRRQAERMRQRRAGLLGVAHFLVVAGEVAHADCRQQLVAPLHFAHAPVERAGGLLHVGDHRRQQVRDPFVDRQLEHLGVDHDHAHGGRIGLVHQRQDHGVDADRLARTGGARHQQVRHLAEIRHHRVAGDVLAQRDGERAGAVVIGLGAENLAQDARSAAWDWESPAPWCACRGWPRPRGC